MTVKPQKWIDDALKVFDPTLTIKYNHNWRMNWDTKADDYKHDMRYLICQNYIEAQPCGGGLWCFKEVWHPILPAGKNGGQEWDNRWLPILLENRLDSGWDPEDEYWENQRRTDKEFSDYVDDWARDRGHWHMRRQYSGFRIPGVKDPRRKMMEKEDRTGELWTPDSFGNDGWESPWV